MESKESDKTKQQPGFSVKPRQSFLEDNGKKGKTRPSYANCLQGLQRSPFLRIQVAGEERSTLLDTGADISLLDESHLTDRQRTHMVPSRKKNPKAASGNEVEILGELRMTVRLGKAVINDHPFQVVRGLVVLSSVEQIS